MLLATLLTLTSGAFEPAVTTTGAERVWEVMPVHWRYDDSDRPGDLNRAEAHEAVSASFSAWNAVQGAKVRFIEADAGVPEDEINLVYWEPDWAWDTDVLALTSTWATDDGEIHKFRIAINAVDPQWATDGDRQSMDLQNALTHEVGHGMGLAHDPDHNDATMAATAKRGEVRKRDLHDSDEDGARYLYPDPLNSGGGCNSAPAPVWAVGFAPLFLFFRRRSRT